MDNAFFLCYVVLTLLKKVMETVQDLFRFVLKQEKTIVFGNLGRCPEILFQALADIGFLEIVIVLDYYLVPSINTQIRILHSNDPIPRCDLLVFMEPKSLQFIDKHSEASRAVIFTSHFTFQTDPKSNWVYVSYFNGKNLAASTRTLLEKQDFSLQTRNVSLVQSNYVSSVILTGQQPVPIAPNTYVIIDLTKFNKDILPMYLAFWNAFDTMIENSSNVSRWVICFPEGNARRSFDIFAQKCIDSLFCRKFEHGNVTHIQELLSLLPFYKSGIVDRRFNIRTFHFGNVEMIAPATTEDACKAAIMYDLEPVVKNVFRIRQ